MSPEFSGHRGQDLPAASRAEPGAEPTMTDEPAEPAATGPLGNQTASGVMWLTIQRWAIRLSGFVTIAILTRFLKPEDFGTVAAASTVLPFFLLLTDLGFAAFVVQSDRVDDRMLSTGFWFSAGAGFALCAVLVGVAPLLGAVFGSPQVVPVLQALSVSVALTGVTSIPLALLRRSMRFKTLAAQGTAAALVAQVVAVVMTLTGFGVWALVGQTLSSPLVQTVLAWVAVKWHPRLVFSREDFVKMARFGSQVLGVEFVAMLRAWAEAAIVSSTLGLAALGYLNIAQRLVQVVQDLTGAALVPVSTVAFAKLRSDMSRLRAAYLRALRMVYAALAPPLTLLAVAAPLVIPIVFGDSWSESNRVTQVLAIAGVMVVGATLDHGLHYGMGKPGQWFVYGLITDACTLAMTAVTARFGLVAVAVGFLAVATVATMVRWFLVARLLQAPVIEVTKPFGFLATAVLTSGLVGLLTSSATAALPPLVQLILIGLAVLAAYLGVAFLMARPVLAEVGGYLARLAPIRRRHGAHTGEDS